MSDLKESEIKIRVSDDEKKMIEKKMNQLSIFNMSAYIRKMAIDGMIIKVDFPEIKELNSNLRRFNNNINQIAKRVNSTDNIYENEIDEIKEYQSQINDSLKSILRKLLKLS